MWGGGVGEGEVRLADLLGARCCAGYLMGESLLKWFACVEQMIGATV